MGHPGTASIPFCEDDHVTHDTEHPPWLIFVVKALTVDSRQCNARSDAISDDLHDAGMSNDDPFGISSKLGTTNSY